MQELWVLDMIQGDHEDAPGQLELNWMYDDVLRNQLDLQQ